MKKDDTDYLKDEFQGCNHYGMITWSTAETLNANREFYSVPKNPNMAISDAISKCKCLSCQADDLKPEYKYCPNCGRLFL